jgi:hypothetical protein
MTDRLRAEAERVAAAAEPATVREPWLAWNAVLIEILNGIALNQEEIKALLQKQTFTTTAAIATGLREYAAGDELHRAAYEAGVQAEIAALRQQLVVLATQRAEDMAQLRQELDGRHVELLAALSRVSGRQARRAKEAAA